METKEANDQTLTRFPLDASFQGVNRLFVLAFNDWLAKMWLVIQLTILLKETVI